MGFSTAAAICNLFMFIFEHEELVFAVKYRYGFRVISKMRESRWELTLLFPSGPFVAATNYFSRFNRAIFRDKRKEAFSS